MPIYGVYDTVDNVWIGDSKGPKLFDDDNLGEELVSKIDARTLAKISAQVIETQVFGTDMKCRYQAREFNEKDLRKKDKVDTKMSALKALQKIEGQAE